MQKGFSIIKHATSARPYAVTLSSKWDCLKTKFIKYGHSKGSFVNHRVSKYIELITNI